MYFMLKRLVKHIGCLHFVSNHFLQQQKQKLGRFRNEMSFRQMRSLRKTFFGETSSSSTSACGGSGLKLMRVFFLE